MLRCWLDCGALRCGGFVPGSFRWPGAAVCCVNPVVVDWRNIASYWVCVLPFGVIVVVLAVFGFGVIGFGR